LPDRQLHIVEAPPSQHGKGASANQQHGTLSCVLPRVDCDLCHGPLLNLCCIRDAAGPLRRYRGISNCSILYPHALRPWISCMPISGAQLAVDIIGKRKRACAWHHDLGLFPAPQAGRNELSWADSTGDPRATASKQKAHTCRPPVRHAPFAAVHTAIVAVARYGVMAHIAAAIPFPLTLLHMAHGGVRRPTVEGRQPRTRLLPALCCDGACHGLVRACQRGVSTYRPSRVQSVGIFQGPIAARPPTTQSHLLRCTFPIH